MTAVRPAVPLLVRAFAMAWLAGAVGMLAPLCRQPFHNTSSSNSALRPQPWHLPLATALHALIAHAPSGVHPPEALALLERMCYHAALQSLLLLGVWWLGALDVATLWPIAAHACACYAWTLCCGTDTVETWLRVCMAVSVLVTTPCLCVLYAGCDGDDVLHPRSVLLAFLFSEMGATLSAWFF